VHFEILSEIEQIETIAVGGRIRDIMRLRRQFGPGRWRKLKGTVFGLKYLYEKKAFPASVCSLREK
jgi:hypothetical protein